MPTHATYIEPFAGKGALMRRKPPALSSILIDKDPHVIAWWKKLDWPGSHVIRGDGIFWLECNGRRLGKDCLVYCDPPYMGETRVKLKVYAYEMDVLQHRRLLRCLQELECPAMITGYECQLYDLALKDWWRDSRPVMTRGRTWRTEVVWMNYDPARASPALATEYSCLGKDYRERERVARKIKRWVTRLASMPETERRAILLSLLDVSRPPSSPAAIGPDSGTRPEDGSAKRDTSGNRCM